MLTEHKEDRLAEYLIKMAEMGFGLTFEDVMHMAFTITGKKWPYTPIQKQQSWSRMV